MARKAAGKTTRINRDTPALAADLERYCRGLDDWPRSWMGWEKDVPPPGDRQRAYEFQRGRSIAQMSDAESVRAITTPPGPPTIWFVTAFGNKRPSSR